MSNSQNSAIGLDVGTSRIVAARPDGDGYRYRSELNAFVDIPFSKITQAVLSKEGIPYAAEGARIFVHGSASERFADLLNGETRRPMLRGMLNSTEPESAKQIQEIIGNLAGSPAEPGQKICFTVPAAPSGEEQNLTYHEATLRHILTELGFQPMVINEGLAVIYSELADSNYTGIGVSCGGGLCNVCFSYLSVPSVTFSIPKAGDFIDSSAASVTGERANRLRILKEESFYLNGHFANNLHQVLTVYYEDMIRALANSLRSAFASASGLPRLTRPVPLVLSGGTAMPKGFRERFEKILREEALPVPISEIRIAADPLTATAKGALVAALASI